MVGLVALVGKGPVKALVACEVDHCFFLIRRVEAKMMRRILVARGGLR